MIDQIRPRVHGNGRRQAERAIFKQQCDPVQHRVRTVGQVQRLQSVRIQFITVDKSIGSVFAGPFPGQVFVLCAVKTAAVIVIFLSACQLGLFHDLRTAVQ